MRRFFQWIDFKEKKSKTRKVPSKKPNSCQPCTAPRLKLKVLVSHGPFEAHELMRAIGKILEEKLACRFESEALQLSQHKKELQTQVKPGKGYPPTTVSLPDLRQEEIASPKSSNQKAVYAGSGVVL